jgi:hypothetical protein
MRNKLKSFSKKFLLFLFLFFCLNYPNGVIFSKENFSESNQSLKVGISDLNLRKSFFDFPIVWKSTMPVFSVSYQIIHGKFRQQISFNYGRSTFIDVNDSKKPGKNYFSILAFNYDLIWYKLRHRENPKFFWGLGASLENLEIVQKIEICPGKYNEYTDQYMGIGPRLDLLWKFTKVQCGFSLGSILSIPYASFSIMNSDVAFTNKSYLWWFKIKTNLHCQLRISKSFDFLVELSRDAFTYGRTHRKALKPERFYSGGSVIFKSLEMGLSYNF